jgi:hypothetical protein
LSASANCSFKGNGDVQSQFIAMDERICKEFCVAGRVWRLPGAPRHAPVLRVVGWLSVSESNLLAVEEYIRSQEEHHRKLSFEDEFRLLLEKHGMTYIKDED